MSVIKIDQFKGMAPKLASRMLPAGQSVKAQNCVFGSGSLRALPVPLEIIAANSALLSAGKKTALFQYGSHWLQWVDQDVNVCRSSVALDSFDRLYWSGDTSSPNGPKMADNSKIVGNGGAKPQGGYRLGIPKPISAPIATYAPTPTLEALARNYAYCYRSFCGEEGPLSDVSNIVSVDDGVGSVSITGMDITQPNGCNIIEKIIYRSNTGSNSTGWQLVAVVPLDGTGSGCADHPYQDTKLSSTLSEICPSETWIAPNTGIKGLVSHPGGFLVGYYDNVLCFSESYLPHAWPAAYQMVMDHPIVSVGIFGNSILVTTTGMLYLVTGSSPASLSTPEKLERGESCISKRSFVDLGYACAWAGPSGLWLASTGSVTLATESIMKPADWMALLTSIGAENGNLLGAQHGSAYIGFGTSGGFVFDSASGDYSVIDIVATAAHYNQATGKLYLIVGGAIVEWLGGTTVKQMTWKSRPERLVSPDTMGVIQIFAGSYSPPPIVKVYADGVQVKHLGQPYTIMVTSDNPMVLPGGYTAESTYEVEIISSTEIIPPLLMATCLLELG